MKKWEQFRQFYSHFASFLKVCMPAIAERTHRKVNPVDDASLFQQQLVEDLLIPKRYKFFLLLLPVQCVTYQGLPSNHCQESWAVTFDVVRSGFLHGQEPISTWWIAYIDDAKSLYRRCKKPLKRIV